MRNRSQESEVRSQESEWVGKPPSLDSLEHLLRTTISELKLNLSPPQLQQLAMHFSLLLRWNQKINLSAIRDPREIARRHFEESLFLATLISAPEGMMVDVGSGAGFPGLPLKITWPAVETILLEPNQKKATFLKEVVRACGLEKIAVRTERLEETVRGELARRATLVTMRAVRPSEEVLHDLRELLAADGGLALFLGEADASVLSKVRGFHWEPAVPIPGSERRVILLGRRTA